MSVAWAAVLVGALALPTVSAVPHASLPAASQPAPAWSAPPSAETQPTPEPAADPSEPEPDADPSEPEPEALGPFEGRWEEIPQTLDAVGSYATSLLTARERYEAAIETADEDVAALAGQVAELVDEVAALEAAKDALNRRLTRTDARLAAEDRHVGALARSIYQLPGAQLSAFAQLMEGESLRPLESQDLLRDVLAASVAEADRLRAAVRGLGAEIAGVVDDIERTTVDVREIRALQDNAEYRRAMLEEALAEIASELKRARGAYRGLAAAEAELLASVAVDAGVPSGDVVPNDLPAEVPFRDVFIRYGTLFQVDPALLAAIASQESGFDPNAGCQRIGAGKGLMQHEGQSQFCGVDAVPASVAKAAGMLASYYRQSGSWSAAAFAYNNGPGLMSTWVDNADDPQALLAALTSYYDSQSYAGDGPYAGYSSWGAWRARVAFSYASAQPIPGFHSAVAKWLAYRGDGPAED